MGMADKWVCCNWVRLTHGYTVKFGNHGWLIENNLLKPFEHHSIITSPDLWGALNSAPTMAREIIFFSERREHQFKIKIMY